jgi:hypothetical protein
MTRLLSARTLRVVGALTLVGGAACNDDSMSPFNRNDDSAFLSLPAGMESTASSFAGDGQMGMAWGGPFRGGPGGPGMRDMMGGGLGPGFTEGPPGRGPHGGPFSAARIDDSCTVAGVDVTCTDTRNGLTIRTIYNLTTATGASQTKIDTSTTNTIRTRTSVTGTTTRGRDGANVTAVVDNSSERTVTGLAGANTQRTVNGWSRGN